MRNTVARREDTRFQRNGAFDPAFSPDARKLAIDSDADGVAGIFIISARTH